MLASLQQVASEEVRGGLRDAGAGVKGLRKHAAAAAEAVLQASGGADAVSEVEENRGGVALEEISSRLCAATANWKSACVGSARKAKINPAGKIGKGGKTGKGPGDANSAAKLGDGEPKSAGSRNGQGSDGQRVGDNGDTDEGRDRNILQGLAAKEVNVRPVELLVPDEEAAALASGKAGMRNTHKILRQTSGQVWKLKSNWIKNWKKQRLSVDAGGLVYAKQASGPSQTQIPLDKILTVALARPGDMGNKVRLRPEAFLVSTRDGRTHVFASDVVSSADSFDDGSSAAGAPGTGVGVGVSGSTGNNSHHHHHHHHHYHGTGNSSSSSNNNNGGDMISGPAWCRVIASHVLLHAVQHGMSRERVVQFCELGADLNCAWRDGRQYPPLALAMQNGDLEVAKYLLRRGADPSCLLRWSFLMMDKIARPVDILNMLIETKKDLNVCSDDPHGWTLLHYLAFDGDLDSVQRLIARVDVPTIRAVNTLGDDSLMLALKRHGPKPGEVIENLCLALAKNSDVLRRDKWNDTVLHVAIKQGHLELARRVIKMGAKIEERDAEGNTALHVAVKTQAFMLARWMVERMPKNDSTKSQVLNLRDERKGDTVLALALKLDEEDLALFFLRHGADPSLRSSSWDLTPDCASDSPLHVAIKMDMRELAEAMSAPAARDDSRKDLLREADTRGVPVLVLAMRRTMLKLALLIVRAAEKDSGILDAVTRKEGDAALHVALEHGWFMLACALVDAGASVNVQNRKGHTALHLCIDRLTQLSTVSPRCERVILALMRGLLDNHADASLRSGSLQHTCLHAAVIGKQRAAVALLLGHHADLADVCDKDGYSSLALAVLQGDPDLVQLLLDHGADVDVVSKQSLSTLHLALQAAPADQLRTAELCSLLLRHGAYPGIWDRAGRCPVHHMAARNLDKVIKALAADCKVPGHLDLRTETGETAAMLAVTHGALDALNVLLENGIDLDAKVPATRRGIFHIAGDLCVSRTEPFWSSGVPQRLLNLDHTAKVYDRDVAGTSVVGAKSFIRRCINAEGGSSAAASMHPNSSSALSPGRVNVNIASGGIGSGGGGGAATAAILPTSPIGVGVRDSIMSPNSAASSSSTSSSSSSSLTSTDDDNDDEDEDMRLALGVRRIGTISESDTENDGSMSPSTYFPGRLNNLGSPMQIVSQPPSAPSQSSSQPRTTTPTGGLHESLGGDDDDDHDDDNLADEEDIDDLRPDTPGTPVKLASASTSSLMTVPDISALGSMGGRSLTGTDTGGSQRSAATHLQQHSSSSQGPQEGSPRAGLGGSGIAAVALGSGMLGPRPTTPAGGLHQGEPTSLDAEASMESETKDGTPEESMKRPRRDSLYDPELKEMYLSLPPTQRVEIVELIKLEGKLVAQQWLTTPQGQARLQEDADTLISTNPSLSPLQAQQEARQHFVQQHLTSWFQQLEILQQIPLA